MEIEEAKPESAWRVMIVRGLFWVFFVLLLLSIAALGCLVWEGTRPTPGANMAFMTLPLFLGPMAFFAAFTVFLANAHSTLERRIGWVAMVLALVALLFSIAGASFA